MKNVSGRICVVSSVVVALAAATATQATTFSIKPTVLNPACVAGTGIGSTCVQDSDCDTNLGSGDGVCEGTEVTLTCTGGATPGAACNSRADCGAGVCGPDASHELSYEPTCYSVDPENPVPNDGQPCEDTADCESAPGARDGLCRGNYTIELSETDVLITEVYVSDWSPTDDYPDEAVRLWQLGLDIDTFMNGECDPAGVFPLGWDRPREQIPCATNLDCPGQYPICDALNAICVGPNHHPEEGSFIDSTNPDYIFYGLAELPAVDYAQFRFGSRDMQPGTEPLYTPPPKYLATITFKVATNACGIYTIEMDESGTWLMNDIYGQLLPFALENLVVITDIVPPTVEWTEPANCIIDPGQTREPDVAGAQGLDTFVFHFKSTDELAGVTAGLFDLRGVPLYPDFPSPPPEVSSVDVDNVNKVVTAYLDKPINPGNNGRWTCIKWVPRGQEFCWGYLPGDVTNDRATAQNDIGTMINHLVDPVAHPLELHQCDINRSGACTGADLLRLIDLYQGGSPYGDWEGGSLISCPTNQVPTAKRTRPVR